MAAVEPLCIDAVHPLHAGRERRALALDDQVEMRVHQAPGDDPPAALEDLPSEQRQQELAFGVVGDDGRRPHAAHGDVVDPRRRELVAWDSWHGDEASCAQTRPGPPLRILHAYARESARSPWRRGPPGTVPAVSARPGSGRRGGQSPGAVDARSGGQRGLSPILCHGMARASGEGQAVRRRACGDTRSGLRRGSCSCSCSRSRGGSTISSALVPPTRCQTSWGSGT